VRCIVVNGATLKAGAYCAHCHGKIGENYIREIGTRRMYCDYRCYGDAVEAPIGALVYRIGRRNSGTFHS
jgi:hypothetical protein